MVFILPRFIAFQSKDKDYMGYFHDDEKKEYIGYLKFSESQFVSPYVKFAVESAAEAGLFHIRSCVNNKYWERTKNLAITGKTEMQYWITATATKKEENQSKETCTLFKPLPVDTKAKTIRLMHVQSGCYLCIWRFTNPTFNRFVLSNYDEYDKNSYDLFTVVDWESLLILPKFLAFKGSNDKYLRVRSQQSHPYLEFSTDDIGEATVTNQIFFTPEGYIRIKNKSTNKFWRWGENWIWADSSDTKGSDKATLFRPIKIGHMKLGLISLGNNQFCKRLSTDGKTDCLNAGTKTLTSYAQITAEEPVLTREYYNVRYDLSNSRVYDEKVLLVSKNSASNYTQQATSLDVKLSYTDTQTRVWSTNVSITKGSKVTFKIGVPKVGASEVEISSEVQNEVTWEDINTISTLAEVTHSVTVPPMTKVTVNLIASSAKCDVPFSFMQKDTLYNGETVVTEVATGSFTGSNFFKTEFTTTEEKVTA